MAVLCGVEPVTELANCPVAAVSSFAVHAATKAIQPPTQLVKRCEMTPVPAPWATVGMRTPDEPTSATTGRFTG